MYHLDIYIGADLVEAMLALNDSEPHDLTGATIAAKMRASLSNGSATAFTCNVIDAENGIFTVELAAAATADLHPGHGVWDGSITQAGKTEHLLEGTYTIRQRAAR